MEVRSYGAQPCKSAAGCDRAAVVTDAGNRFLACCVYAWCDDYGQQYSCAPLPGLSEPLAFFDCYDYGHLCGGRAGRIPLLAVPGAALGSAWSAAGATPGRHSGDARHPCFYFRPGSDLAHRCAAPPGDRFWRALGNGGGHVGRVGARRKCPARGVGGHADHCAESGHGPAVVWTACSIRPLANRTGFPDPPGAVASGRGGMWALPETVAV